MFRGKRCRRMLELAAELSKPEDDTSIPKYRRVYQRLANTSVSQPSSSGLKILEDVIIKPAETPMSTSDATTCINDCEITPKRRKHFHQQKVEPETYMSPSTNLTFQTLKNVDFSTPTSNVSKGYKSISPYCESLGNKNLSLASVQNKSSRCSSVSDLSCASYLTSCPLNAEQITDILSTSVDISAPIISKVIDEKPAPEPVLDGQSADKQIADMNKNLADGTIFGNIITCKNNPEVPPIVNTMPSTSTSSTYESRDTDIVVNTDNNQPLSKDMPIQDTPSTSYSLRKINRSTLDSITRNLSSNMSSDDESDTDFTPETDDSSFSECTSTSSEVSDNEDSGNSDLRNENSNTESSDNEWQDITYDVPVFPEYEGDFTANIPPTAKKPIDYFELFVTEEIVNKMVQETNNYAQKYLSDNQMKPKSRAKAWTPTNSEEMKRFLGALMVMGLVKVPHINDYWSKKSIYKNDFIISIMKRDRFLLLLKFWHFSDAQGTGKLHKINDILLMLLNRFQTILKPGKYLVIDESMVPWRGRLQFRQYIKNKSHKYGVKLYKLCTPEGYTYSLIVYTGKGEDGRELDHGPKTVMRLIKDLTNEGRIVITDNFYNSTNLAEELIKNKTFLCGTLRANRKGLPKTVISTKLKKGEIVGKMNPNGVRVFKWVDKRPVHMISTCRKHDINMINTNKKKRGTGELIKKPGCVLMYNECKKGIDYSDQMSSYYSTLKRGVKWFRKVMMELLFGTALVNSWVVFNLGRETKMSKKDYIEFVIEGLTKKTISTDETGPVQSLKLKKNHVFEKKGPLRRKCIHCYKNLRVSLNSKEANKKVKKIISFCQDCNKPMCLKCFYESHM